jgi:hypothetical protein
LGAQSAARQKTQFSRETPVKTLDAGNAVNKKQIKTSITAAIANQVFGSNIEDIALRVEETYERLLIGAATSEHVPSLTTGLVKRDVISSMRRQG